MSREIKFRGRSLITNDFKWVYGWLTHTNKKFLPCIHVGVVEVYSVSAESVGQFTGLKDKNGKEIYEGDIIDYRFWNKSGRASITFEDGSFGLSEYSSHFKDNFFKAFTFWDEPDVDCFPFIEIIGNIYENPELLSHGDNI